ncbi:MAG: hypothetical protein IKT40_12065 [Bacilli bacterium]|nr:hypothetical protein [Bacilli bacterium]
MKLRFIKLSNKWFVDIPWEGDVEDLQMVSGSDILLDILSHGNFFVDIDISTDYIENSIKLVKKNEDEFGCYYSCYTYEFKGEIWLCNVTKHLFGGFTNEFFIKIV